MDSSGSYAQYVEALVALDQVDYKQRQALSRAVEASATAENNARSSVAEQQRMFDRASRDALDADRALTTLRSTLGLPEQSPPVQARSGQPPKLAEVRAAVLEITQWAIENQPIAESLIRTKARLAAATPAATPPQRTSGEASPQVRSSPAPIVAVVAAVLAVAAVLVALIVT